MKSENQLTSEIAVVQADITTLEVDAIVNAANNRMLGGGGVDGAIHRAAGPELKQACIPLNGCATGDAKVTPGFNLPAKYVIHAVGPIYFDDPESAPALLASAYRRSLEIANELKLKTIAFPAISTGVYGYPASDAAKIAVATCRAFLSQPSNQLETVLLVAFSDADAQTLRSALSV